MIYINAAGSSLQEAVSYNITAKEAWKPIICMLALINPVSTAQSCQEGTVIPV